MSAADVATWLQAVGTAGALLVTAAVLALQMRDRHRGQAEKVSAWPGTSEPESQGFREPKRWVISLQNAGDVPVWAPSLLVTWQSATGEEMVRTFGSSIVPPGEVLKFDTGISASVYRSVPQIDLLFRDGAGRFWQRDENGFLIHLRGSRGYISSTHAPIGLDADN